MTTEQATTKIVIVAGQEFSVPADTDNEAIRQQLTQMGFADVASATIQKGTREIDGVKHETVEFVKKAGTKGLDSAELAALLGTLPPTEATARRHGLTAQQWALLDRLTNGALTIDEATCDPAAMDELLRTACEDTARPDHRTEGGLLCAPIDALPAVAACAPCAW